MKTQKSNVIRIGLAALLATVILTACVVNPPAATGTPTPGETGVVPYPAYPGINITPAYPAPAETLSPDSPVTAPAYPPIDQPPGEPLPYAPQPADAALQRSEVFLNEDEVDILTLESFPPQFNLVLKGSLPTPCHQLRVTVESPNPDNEIVVDAYSVVDPGRMCTQVLEPLEATIPLRDLEAGTYTVAVNGLPAGQITVP